MTNALSQAPVLSTPESHIFEDPTPALANQNPERYTEKELWDIYEIERTAKEIKDGGYKRVALQFPDQMLIDAPKISQMLEKELEKLGLETQSDSSKEARQSGIQAEDLETNFNKLNVSNGLVKDTLYGEERRTRTRLYILADTSYGSCCVDEIAAEHADAEVVVHYGRSCLSPTARLPVIYVFTTRPLDLEDVIRIFSMTFSEKDEKVVLMADITYDSHTPAISKALADNGYQNIVTPSVIHDPSSAIPNRKVKDGLQLEEHSLFHISDPPDALLLTLSSRVKDMYIYPTDSSHNSSAIKSNTSMALRRRYGLLTSLSTCPIFGILINTLSVRNYLQTVTSIQSLFSRAGKKSYTFVVGKVNAAKIANFSEIGGWVVVGCWESSLIDSKEFYRPIITPFELSLALQGDKERIWTGSWRGDFAGLEEIANQARIEEKKQPEDEAAEARMNRHERMEINYDDEDSESESEPPEFDLRTGRYVSHSRPMRNFITTPAPTASSQAGVSTKNENQTEASIVLTRRAKGDLATINGAVSPGAEYLRSQRTWTGLGSDFAEVEGTDGIEEGRSGVARGYVVGEGREKR